MTLAALLLPLLLSCEALTDAIPCPRVHPVLLGSGTGESVDILFLGDGFTEDELDRYRCAVQQVTHELLELSPFMDHECNINVYRMDLISDGSIDMGCSDCPALEPMDEPACPEEFTIASGGSEFDGPECAGVDLNTRFCADGSTCHFLWLDGDDQSTAVDLAFCAGGKVRSVIILADSGTYGGGASVASDDGIPIAVFSASSINDGEATFMLAHELGHALFGLLDEYPSGSGSAYYADRNIATEDDLDDSSYLWSEACDGGECDVICSENVGDVTGNPVELFEGAFFHSCGFYRSMMDCRMDNVWRDSCHACQLRAGDAMEEMGVAACE